MLSIEEMNLMVLVLTTGIGQIKMFVLMFFDIVAIYQWCFGCDFDDCDDDQDDDDDVDVQGRGIQQMDLAVLLLLSSGPSLTRLPTR